MLETSSSTFRSFRSALTALHPRGRRWLQFLRSLTLNPDELPRPVAPPGERDFIMCGAPRTGTTLLSAMLFQPPAVVTVMEPWAGLKLPPDKLFESIRHEIELNGRLMHGQLDFDAMNRKRLVRRVPEGESTPRVRVDEGYYFGVKWPAFWRYLDYLPKTKFLVCVRHPFEVISSFKSEGGRLALGQEYDIAFNHSMNSKLRAATGDLQLRRVLMYQYINAAVLEHYDRANVYFVRYERWFTEPRVLLDEISRFLDVPLPSMPVDIRKPRGSNLLGEKEKTLIRRRCSDAARFGYDLGETVTA